MSSFSTVETLPSIISTASSQADSASQGLINSSPIGQIIDVVSQVPIKSNIYASTREGAIDKYVTTRYSMNGGLVNSNDKLSDTFGNTINDLSVSPGDLGTIPITFQEGHSILKNGFSVRFPGFNEGLIATNNSLTQTQMNSNNWQVEITFNQISTPTTAPRHLWSFEDGTNGYGLVVSTGNVLQFWNKVANTFTTMSTALTNGVWYVVSFSSLTGGTMRLNINGETTTPASITRPTFTLSTPSTFSIGYSPIKKLATVNSSVNAYIEDVLVYNGAGEDRVSWWDGSGGAGINKWNSTWRYRSSYTLKNPPADWLLSDNTLALISENSKLYNQIGTTFGGDGITTFKLPPSSTLGTNYYKFIRAK